MVTNIINLIVECMKLLVIMCGILNFKFNKSKAAVTIFFSTIIILILIGIYDGSYQISGLIFLAVIICGLSVKGKYRFILCVLSFFCICCIDEFLMLMIKSAFKITDEIISVNPAVFSAANAFSLIILTPLAMIMQNLYYKNKHIAEINQKLLYSQEKYYRMLLEKENETRKFRHDISNHILCVDALLKEHNYDEAEIYLSDLKSSISELKPRYQTGNMLVNVIVNDISGKYENVNLVWTGIIPEKLHMSDMDICIIFSNVLENAFCAASDCMYNGKVEVVIKSLFNSLDIYVRNNMSRPVEEKKGKLITQKSDKKNHGFGTMNLRTCVNINGGSVVYKYTESIFTTEIILPNVI